MQVPRTSCDPTILLHSCFDPNCVAPAPFAAALRLSHRQEHICATAVSSQNPPSSPHLRCSCCSNLSPFCTLPPPPKLPTHAHTRRCWPPPPPSNYRQEHICAAAISSQQHVVGSRDPSLTSYISFSIRFPSPCPLFAATPFLPSGKSTFAQQLSAASSRSWVRVNQDTAGKGGKRGTRQQCVKAAQTALATGRNVVVDRCVGSLVDY